MKLKGRVVRMILLVTLIISMLASTAVNATVESSSSDYMEMLKAYVEKEVELFEDSARTISGEPYKVGETVYYQVTLGFGPGLLGNLRTGLELVYEGEYVVTQDDWDGRNIDDSITLDYTIFGPNEDDIEVPGTDCGFKGTMRVQLEETLYEVTITPHILEKQDSTLVPNTAAGSVKVSVESGELGELTDTALVVMLADGTIITFEAVAATGYEFYTWKHNIINDLEEGDIGFRPNPRDVQVIVANDKTSFGPTPVFVKEEEPEEEPVNLWVAADDGADVYIDGAMIDTYISYSSATEDFVPDMESPFFAVEAWDGSGQQNIAGFKLTAMLDEETYESTDSTWFYHIGDVPSDGWVNEVYTAPAGEEWLPVTAFTLANAPTPRNWAPDSDFPDAEAMWIWAPNYNVGDGDPSADAIDTPVYFRSEEPDVEEEPEEPEKPRKVTKTYDLIVNVVGNGSVPGFEVTRTFTAGSNVNLSAVADVPTDVDDLTEYKFSDWSGDLISNLNDVSIQMTGNKTVTATFIEIIEDEEVPQDIPEVEILDKEVAAEAGDDIEDEALPQTGGVPMEAMSLLGLAFMAVGAKVRKRK